MTHLVKAVLIAVIAAGAGIGALTEISSFFTKRAAVAARNDTLRAELNEHSAAVETLLRDEMCDRGLTYSQLFDRGEDRLRRIDDVIIRLRTADLGEPQQTSATAYAVQLYMVLARDLNANRRALEAEAQMEAVNAAFKSLAYYERRRIDPDSYARQSVNDAMGEQEQADADAKQAYRIFGSKLKDMRAFQRQEKRHLADYRLVDDALLGELIKALS